jgi:hypothetical protein
MEGKEARFGIADSALFATVTTDTSCGAVNSMHDSFTPPAGMISLIDIQLGDVIFGGVGSGIYGMLLFAGPERPTLILTEPGDGYRLKSSWMVPEVGRAWLVAPRLGKD